MMKSKVIFDITLLRYYAIYLVGWLFSWLFISWVCLSVYQFVSLLVSTWFVLGCFVLGCLSVISE